MLNIKAMKLITYIVFGVMVFYSVKDFNKMSKENEDKAVDTKLLIKYMHRIELRIGAILFFIMLNILIGLQYI